MSPKYKNDLAKCFAVLRFDHNWKSACEDFSTFCRVLSDLTTELTKADDTIHPISTEGDQDKLYCSIEAFLNAY
ncbi:unnamed protein product, partial [Dicrocoelium dendriticum]